MREIFCLFSIENNYDQPDHNLVCWWPQEPTLQELTRALPAGGDQVALDILAKRIRRIDNTDYFLEVITAGVVLS